MPLTRLASLATLSPGRGLELRFPTLSFGERGLELKIPTVSFGDAGLELRVPTLSLGERGLELRIPTLSLRERGVELRIPTLSPGERGLELKIPPLSSGERVPEACLRQAGTRAGEGSSRPIAGESTTSSVRVSFCFLLSAVCFPPSLTSCP
jgi:hypothetical protein